MKLLQALRNSVRHVAANFEDSKLFKHSGDKGEFRERIIEQFLRPFLPPCFGLGSGEVFAEDGSASNQIDIVIYDAVFSNVLFRDSHNSLFPCESVFGTIEVKSELTTEQLEKSIENIASVKKLKREPTNMLDFLPLRRFEVDENVFSFDKTLLNPYLGFVFAYGGLTAETVASVMRKQLSSAGGARDLLPDYIFLYERKSMVMRTLATGASLTPAKPGGPFHTFSAIPAGEDILPLFFLMLNALVNQIRLKTPNFSRYWAQVFQQVANQPQQLGE